MVSHVEESVIRRLRSAGGIKVDPRGRADLVLSVQGGETEIQLEVKHRFSEQVIDQLERLPPQERARTVLVVPRLPMKRRNDLRKRGVSWVEYKTGAVHLRVPGLAIDLPEERLSSAGRDERIPSLAGKAGIVVEALVELGQRQELVAQPDVAALSESTQAWTSKVFSALVGAGALEVVGSGPSKRWRPNIEELLALWTDKGGPSPTVTEVFAWARSDNDLLRMIARAGEGTPYAIGGTAAANLHEPTLTAVPTVGIWIPAATPPGDVATQLDGDVIESGPNILLWQAPGDPALCLARPLARWRSEAPAEVGQLSVVTPGRAAVEALESSGRGPDVGDNLRRTILRSAAAQDA